METRPTSNELQMASRGYLLVGSDFESMKGLKNKMLTHDAADDTMVFMTIRPGWLFILFENEIPWLAPEL